MVLVLQIAAGVVLALGFIAALPWILANFGRLFGLACAIVLLVGMWGLMQG